MRGPRTSCPTGNVPWPVLTSRSSSKFNSAGTWCQHPGTFLGALYCQVGTAMLAISAVLVPVPPGRPQEPRQGTELLLNTCHMAEGTDLVQKSPILFQVRALHSWVLRCPSPAGPLLTTMINSHNSYTFLLCLKEYKSPINKQINVKL